MLDEATSKMTVEEYLQHLCDSLKGKAEARWRRAADGETSSW